MVKHKDHAASFKTQFVAVHKCKSAGWLEVVVVREGKVVELQVQHMPRADQPACLPRVIGCSKRNSFFRHALPLGGERGLYARYRSSLDARVCV